MSAETGATLKAYRWELGLTQQQFADRLGISRSALTQMEAGKTKPSYEVMERLLDEFSIDPTVFFHKGESASMERRTMADVNRVTDYWYEQYRDHYETNDVFTVLVNLERLIEDEIRKAALRNINSLYRNMADIVDELDFHFIDPVKRYSLQLKELQDTIKVKHSSPEFEKDVSELKARVNELADRAEHYWDLKGRGYSAMGDPLTPEILKKPVRKGRGELLRYGQEKYLRAFFFLLDHSESLEEVRKYYRDFDGDGGR